MIELGSAMLVFIHGIAQRPAVYKQQRFAFTCIGNMQANVRRYLDKFFPAYRRSIGQVVHDMEI